MNPLIHLRLVPAALLAAAACAAEPGAAVVAPAPQQGVDFTKRADNAPAPSPGDNTVIVTRSDNGQVTELRMHNDDDVRVIVNGRVIDKPHIKRDGHKVIVLGDDGQTLTTFELEGMPGIAAIAPPHAPSGVAAVAPSVGFYSPAPTPREAPPVMLGISLGDVGPALREHLSLGDREAILVERVLDDTPAAEAGLRQWDVIVSIDGSDDAGGQTLHEALMGHKPGDQLRLKVIRGCDEKSIKVELAPYDAQKLAMSDTNDGELEIEQDWPAPQAFSYSVPSPAQPYVMRDWQDMVREQLSRRLSGRELEEAIKAMNEAIDSAHFDAQPGQNYGVFEFKWDGDKHKLVIPKGAPQWSQQVPDQWGQALKFDAPKLEKRVERSAEETKERFETLQRELEQRMDRLAEQIERLSRAMEQMKDN
ncbi:MAG: PDZ domain-containing protein [Phycisphaerales bacterium]